jgi:hypothetical protein
MPRPTDLTDPFFQTMLVEAEQALDNGDYLGTVRRCVEVYSRIAEQRPDLILRPPNPLMPLPPARSVREVRRNALHPWPVRLGVGINFDDQGKPHLTFEKEGFSLSEAASYLEYTLDVAIRAQRG